VLVDNGSRGDLDRIVLALRAHSVAPKDLDLIVQTHGHADHAGCAARASVRGRLLL
jgi:hydroxyacylglutathione hydrolase